MANAVQVSGEYKVNTPALQPLAARVSLLRRQFASFKVQHVRRCVRRKWLLAQTRYTPGPFAARLVITKHLQASYSSPAANAVHMFEDRHCIPKPS